MKHVDKPEDLVAIQTRRAKFLIDRPVKGDVMYRNGEPVKVVGTDDFKFEVKYESAGDGIQSAPFEEFTRGRGDTMSP